MKKSELKNIIKECVKEVIFEEGVLSGIISEVAQGLTGASSLMETNMRKPSPSNPPSAKHEEVRRQVLAAAGQNSYENVKQKFKNPELFEGTRPIPESGDRGPLAGVAPGDSGIDISQLPGAGSWGHVAKMINEKKEY
jgi:hypothetical protein